MSANANPSDLQVLPPEDAHSLVYDRLYAPVFFEKLANDYNIVPATQEEAVEMLTIAERLRSVAQVQQTKQASANSSTLRAAREQLDSILGLNNPVAHQHAVVKEAGAIAAADPAIANALLSLQVAQQARQQTSNA